MIDTSWSQLALTPIGRAMEAVYAADPRRTYHNWTHISRGFHHAKHTFNLPYDVNLDLAWLGHDIVYDELPDKEIRSIDMTYELYEQLGPIDGVNMTLVECLIGTSINHQSGRDDRLIKIDLADLADNAQTDINYDLIRSESMRLYNYTDAQAALGSFEFMNRFRSTIVQNSRTSSDGQFWSLVLRGVDRTIKNAESQLQ